VNALLSPSKTGVNALLSPSKTGVNALVPIPIERLDFFDGALVVLCVKAISLWDLCNRAGHVRARAAAHTRHVSPVLYVRF
jgi:hypothetical protein